MSISYANTIIRYDESRKQAREIAHEALPSLLKRVKLKGVDTPALASFRTWQFHPDRKVDWDWLFAPQYCKRYPKAFDLSIWLENKLLSLSLGRPTYKGTSMRLDFIERSPAHSVYAGQMFGITQLAFETYGRLIGAEFLRVIEPQNEKLIKYYTSQDGGFKFMPAHKGNPHYLVKPL